MDITAPFRRRHAAASPFPSLVIRAEGFEPSGSFAEAQAAYLEPDPALVAELTELLAAKNAGVVAHFYMDAELQGVLSASDWPHVHVSDSLAMADRAIAMAEAGVRTVLVLGVDFMSENVRAMLDAAGFGDVAVYRVAAEPIGCSLAAAAETAGYGAWLMQAARVPSSLHVVYINTSLRTKAKAHGLVPTITCTSSNVVQTVLSAFAQVPEGTVWFGPDTCMGHNLKALFTAYAAMDDAAIRALHPAHDRASMARVVEGFHCYEQGACIVHRMFGRAVAERVQRDYADAFVTAHLEVPGEMFSIALAGQRQGRGVVGSTSNILAFIGAKVDEAEARGEATRLRFVLGTEAGMITSIRTKGAQVPPGPPRRGCAGGRGGDYLPGGFGGDHVDRRRGAFRGAGGRGRRRLLGGGRLRDLPLHEDELPGRPVRRAAPARRGARGGPGPLRAPHLYGDHRGPNGCGPRGRAHPAHARVPAGGAGSPTPWSRTFARGTRATGRPTRAEDLEQVRDRPTRCRVAGPVVARSGWMGVHATDGSNDWLEVTAGQGASRLPLHPGWPPILATLQEAGVGPEIDPRSLGVRLGARAPWPPSPDAVSALLDDYYRGDGLSRVAMRRARSDRYVAHREGEHATATTLVARLRWNAPELGPVELLEEETRRGKRLVLHTPGGRAYLARIAIGTLGLPRADGPVVLQRTVTVAALMTAANALLAARGARFRYLPLDGPDHIEAFLGVTGEAARILDGIDSLRRAPRRAGDVRLLANAPSTRRRLQGHRRRAAPRRLSAAPTLHSAGWKRNG